MKKVLFILSIILLVSCGKDEQKTGLEADVIGKWSVTESYIDGKWITTNYDFMHIEFTGDKKFNQSVGGLTPIFGTYSISGNKITLKVVSDYAYINVITLAGDNSEFKLSFPSDPEIMHFRAKRIY